MGWFFVVKVVIIIFYKKIRKALANDRAEANYFSTVFFIFIAVLLLAFIIDLFSIISTKQELDHAADQMVKQIQLSGESTGKRRNYSLFYAHRLKGQEISATLLMPPISRQLHPA